MQKLKVFLWLAYDFVYNKYGPQD